MSRTLLVALLVLAAAAPISAEPVKIEGVKGIVGPECAADAMTSALNAGLKADLPEHYLQGFSGIAFLATVCQNNCLCRDYREATVHIQGALRDLGFHHTYLHGQKMRSEEAWRLVKESIDRSIPAVVFNLFGGWEDVPMVGYDLERDVAWGMQPGKGDEPQSAPLSKWRSAEIWGYVFGPEVTKGIDRRALERERLLEVVASSFRPRLDGG